MRSATTLALVLLVLLGGDVAAQQGTDRSPPGSVPVADSLPVTVFKEADGLPRQQQVLFREVQETLQRIKPRNPGRSKSFGKTALVGFTPRNAATHRLKQTGWYMQVLKAERIPGGWRARVVVYVAATNLDGRQVLILNGHYEQYKFLDNKLLLERDWVDPNRDPSRGLQEAVPFGAGYPGL